MDTDRFDALTRSLFGAASSRRRLLTSVAGIAVGSLAVTLGFAEAEAADVTCLPVGKRCKNKGQCCSSRCKNGRCRAHHVGRCTAAKDTCMTGAFGCGGGSCLCLRTTGGANFCGSGGGIYVDCTTDAECATALKTPGAACVDSNHGNCSGPSNLCALPCTA
jgi:hypothetical protein